MHNPIWSAEQPGDRGRWPAYMASPTIQGTIMKIVRIQTPEGNSVWGVEEEGIRVHERISARGVGTDGGHGSV